MGKKSRRPARNKQKGTAAASSTISRNAAVAAQQAALNDQFNQMSIFNQLWESGDREGCLRLESTVTRVANAIENTDPAAAGSCYSCLGTAHKDLGGEGGIEQAMAHFQTAVRILKKVSNKASQMKRLIGIAIAYIPMGRIQEAMDLYKSLVTHIGKEHMDPPWILEFTSFLNNHGEFGRALEVLEGHLDVIESTWDKKKQAQAYAMIGDSCFSTKAFNKAIAYLERVMSIAKEIKDLTLETHALTRIGFNHRMLQWDQLRNEMIPLDQLYWSKDWEGYLKLEATVTRVANEIENMDPEAAGTYYYCLANVHRELGREGGVDRAIVCYQKAIEIAKKASDKHRQEYSVLGLTDCYVKTGRIQEAMDLHKSLVADIGKECLDPVYLIGFTVFLKRHKEFGRALEVLDEHLDVIESTWDKPNQAKAYGMIADNHRGMYAYNISIVHYERQLAIAKEIKDTTLSAQALQGLGYNYQRMGDYEKAMMYFELRLLARSDYLKRALGRNDLGKAYSCVGGVLLAQDGREQEAIEMFQKASGILETCDEPEELSWTLCKLGKSFRGIEAWDDAITALEKSISTSASIEFQVERKELQSEANQVLGRTYLEQYYSDKSLVGVPETREEVIRKASLCSQEAIKLGRENYPSKPSIYLDLTQEHYFLGDTEKSQAMLKEYFDQTVKLGPSHCQTCHQACPKDAHMEKCSVCKVARYCSRSHSIQAWQKGRLCHKTMCPLLKRWRKLQVGKYSNDSCSAIFNDFFESITVDLPVATRRLSGIDNLHDSDPGLGHGDNDGDPE